MCKVLACRSTSRGAPRASSALSATFPFLTLSFSGAQAGAMPTDGELVGAASFGQLEKVRTLLEVRANVDEKSKVSDGTGTSVAASLSVWHVVLNMVQVCGRVHAAEWVGVDTFWSQLLRFSNEDLIQKSRKRTDCTRQEETSGPDTRGKIGGEGFSGYGPPPPLPKTE